MPDCLLTIGGIPLKVQTPFSRNLAQSFLPFLLPQRKKIFRPWHLQSLPLETDNYLKESQKIKLKIARLKKRLAIFSQFHPDWRLKERNLLQAHFLNHSALGAVSFYLNDPVFIDQKKRQILHFFSHPPSLRADFFTNGLLTQAYSQLLALNKGLLLHSAGVAKNKKAYLFLGPSGEGKSTLAFLCRRNTVLGDDIIALKKTGGSYSAFATPWKQRDFIQPEAHLSFPVAAIFFLKKSQRIFFQPLEPKQALFKILTSSVHFLFYTEEPFIHTLFSTCADFVRNIPAFSMEFCQDKDFWPALEKALADYKIKDASRR